MTSTFELQHNLYLIAEYSPLCLAAGYEQETINQLAGPDVYFLAGAIRKAIKTEAHARFTVIDGCFSEVDYTSCLKSKSASDLKAIRDRIDYQPVTAAR